MTALAELLKARIAAEGPISVAQFMAECLLHPQHGYYTTQTPFGAEGDFITAPEISQMFGELMGLAIAQYWLDCGSPTSFTLAELGPGRGTLMADVLRATRSVPGFHAGMDLVLLEASPALRKRQAKALPGHAPRWIEAIDDLPERPLFLIANEFFDALPIHQYQRDGALWRERLIGLQDGNLSFGLSPPIQGPDPTRFGADAAGTLIETCPLGQLHIAAVGQRIHSHGGLALIADYGGWRSKGDTLQALKDHCFADPLAEPGEADLTAHVDFEALAVRGLNHHYTTQGAFLQALGIDARAARLAANLTGDALSRHCAAHRRLTDPAEMGSLFKVLALTRAGSPPPAGFAHA